MKALLLLPFSLLPLARLDATTEACATVEKDIVTTAVEAGSFKTLAAALQAGELVGALQGEGPFTVFAPTDAAFAALPEGTLESLLKPENKGKLQRILKYHVVAGSMPAAKVIKSSNAMTLAGQRIDFQTKGDNVMVDGATVATADIRCSNGIIHVIDSVILPEQRDILGTATAAGSFKTLAAAIQAAGLVETLSGEGPFTVFAPTDEAFAALPDGTLESLLQPANKQRLVEILTYHVSAGAQYSDQLLKTKQAKTVQGGTLGLTVQDKKVMVGNATVRAADIETTNGVIHVIDKVLLPR